MRHTKTSGPLLAQGLIILVLSLLVIGAAMSLSSCRTCKQSEIITRYIDRTSADSLTRISQRVDSILVRDSIVTVVRGDSVLVDRWHREYREKLRVDTVEKIKIRTIHITRTERITVAPKIPPWYSPANLAKMIMTAFAGYIVGCVLKKLYRKIRQRR